jgi:hypothetical protein
MFMLIKKSKAGSKSGRSSTRLHTLNRHPIKNKKFFQKNKIKEKPQQTGNGQMIRPECSKRFSPFVPLIRIGKAQTEHPFCLPTDGAVYWITAISYHRRRRHAKATAQLKLCRRRRNLIRRQKL